MTQNSTAALQLRMSQTGLRLVEVVSHWNDLFVKPATDCATTLNRVAPLPPSLPGSYPSASPGERGIVRTGDLTHSGRGIPQYASAADPIRIEPAAITASVRERLIRRPASPEPIGDPT